MSVTPRPRKVGSAGATYLYVNPEAPTLPSEQISVDCSLEQANWLEATIDFIEEYPADADRARFVYKDGRASPWFSRRWELSFSHVAPNTD